MSDTYYQRNREAILEKMKRIRLADPEKRKQQQKADIERNGDKRRAKQAEWRAKNRDRVLAKNREWFQANKQVIYEKRKSCAWTPEKQAEYIALYRIKNRERIKERLRLYIESNPQCRVKHRLRGRIGGIVKRANSSVKDRYISLIGCTRSEFLSHIESLFKDGMAWENYGKCGWQIDHIIPCVSFDLTIEAEQLKCFHYTNLQPLWWRDNVKKGRKVLV